MSEKNMSSEVLVLDSEGNSLGRMKLFAAHNLAQEQGLDVVAFSKGDVVKIMDKGKWLYEQKKQNKKVHQPPQKEMQFSTRIDPHDLTIKLDKIQRFLEKGSDVRVVIEMRGREKANPFVASEMMDSIILKFEAFKHDAIKKTSSNVSTILHHNRGHHGQKDS